jgi:hypothetical protein
MSTLTNFTSDGVFQGKPDVQVDYLWELYIPKPRRVDSGWDASSDGMIVRVRSAVIPGFTTGTIESYFLGTKQFYPGRTDFDGTFAAQFEEFQDQKVLTAITAWKNAIFNRETGERVSNRKSDYCCDVVLTCYGTDMKPLPKKIRFVNAWIQAVGSVALSYEGSGAIKYETTFQYDYPVVE